MDYDVFDIDDYEFVQDSFIDDIESETIDFDEEGIKYVFPSVINPGWVDVDGGNWEEYDWTWDDES